jgi:hypothetical protein
MRARVISEGGGNALSFSFLDSDTGPAHPFLHLFVYAQGMSETRARRLVQAYAASRGVPISESETAIAPWSEEGVPPESGSIATRRLTGLMLEIPYAYNCVVGADCAVGRIALGRQDQRFFHLVIQYPPSTAPSFLPMVRAVLQRWRWQN